jgi:predicted metal-binding protein
VEKPVSFKVETCETCGESAGPLVYKRYEAVLPVSDFVFENHIRLACETCPNYQKNLSCPPYSPVFQEYLKGVETATVLCFRIPQECFAELPPERRYQRSFKEGRRLLGRELLDYRKKGYPVAGSGACRACPVCAVAEGEDQCRYPERRIYSLESLGINLTALTRRCFNLDLEWSTPGRSASFVCAIGAAFY